MIEIRIAPVNLSEVLDLQIISRQIFIEAFAESNSEADMKAYLEQSFSVAKLTAELADPNSRFYFARLANEIIGYLKLNLGDAQTELHDPNGVEIERIYVFKAFYGKQVAQTLLAKAREVALEANAVSLWLGVWEQNARAIRFYEKNGFFAFATHIFKLGNDEQTDIMMKMPLKTE